MTPGEDLVHLSHIAQNILEIEGYLQDVDSYESFNTDENERAMIYDLLAQIGVATQLLSDDFKNQYDEIDFRVLESLRNASYNEEMEIFRSPVWHIVKNDLPFIREKIMDVRTKLEEQMDIQGGNTLEGPTPR
ncbi:DUF86 domain-containing protein [Cesiribacter sp. SM1]|uniref:HepT-like ribonuclease domain-containing protein n=1 Tax=Cesiribacter sp. SM1 TaxID=2861196 RepID=UPI001CD49848|nr:HepT-like ribonuclease domain-containing protein [Cesiribacter sp. SM1]